MPAPIGERGHKFHKVREQSAIDITLEARTSMRGNQQRGYRK